jgi:hypothetical protein
MKIPKVIPEGCRQVILPLVRSVAISDNSTGTTLLLIPTPSPVIKRPTYNRGIVPKPDTTPPTIYRALFHNKVVFRPYSSPGYEPNSAPTQAPTTAIDTANETSIVDSFKS